MKDLYDADSVLRYHNALNTAGYLDLLPRPVTGVSSGSSSHLDVRSSADSEHSRSPSPLQSVIKSPHTGRPRPTVASVSLASWPAVPPRTRADYARLSAAGKNKALRGREERWESLEPAQVRTFRAQGPTGVYELQEGIFLMCEVGDLDSPRDRVSSRLSTTVLCDVLTIVQPKIIRLVPLPSVDDPDLEDPIVPTKAHRVKFPIADLTMDPSQDLIVVSEYEPEAVDDDLAPPAHRFHLLSMSTFEPHPLAKLPMLDFPPASVPTIWPRQLLQVMGDTFVSHISREGVSIMGILQDAHAILANDSEEEMVAWNWKTGEVMGRIHLGRTLNACTFCMLTPTTVAVAMPATVRSSTRLGNFHTEVVDEPSITIYSFAQPTTTDVKQPLMRDEEDETTPRAVAVARLRIPEIAPGASLENFHMRPDPSAIPPPADAPTLGRGKPFTLDPARGVVVIEMTIGSDDTDEPIHLQNAHTENFELFILRETLVNLAEEGEARRRRDWAKFGPGAEPDARVYEWDQWGEEHARLLPAVQTLRRQWVCSCSGYRFVSLVPASSDFGGVPVPAPEQTAEELQDDENGPFPIEPLHLVVNDFNPYVVARTRAEARERDADMWTQETAVPKDLDEGQADFGDHKYTVALHDDATTLKAGDAWAEDVTTRLPFRTVRRAINGDPGGAMVDDQRIFLIRTTGVMSSWRTHRQEVTVLCF